MQQFSGQGGVVGGSSVRLSRQNMAPLENGIEVAYNWIDVTKDFTESVKVLKMGELVHDETFSSFEAMSAIELMDPKMDAGLVIRRRKPLSFEDALEQGRLQLKAIDISQLITIMDASIAAFVTWLEDHSLAQTLFTNLYFHRPQEIEDSSLRAFCLGLLRLVAVCRETILRAAVFEEEDFQQTVYGFYYALDISSAKICSMLKEAEDESQKQLRQLKSIESALNDRKIAQLDAVCSRLRFLRLFYTCLAWFVPEDGIAAAYSSSSSSGTRRHNSSSVGPGQASHFSATKPNHLAEFERLLQQCAALLEKISESVKLGTERENDGNYDWLSCVEPFVNQRMLPPTFPRQTFVFGRQKAWQYVRDVVEQLLSICKVADNAGEYCMTLDFFRAFSAKPNVVLTRSALLLFYIPRPVPMEAVYSGITLIDAVRESIKSFISPPIFVQKFNLLQDLECNHVMVDDFMFNCSKVFLSLLQIYGNNRARTREKLGQILEDFGRLSEQAEQLDGFLHTALLKSDASRNYVAVFGSFVLYHTVVCMVEYLSFGFELELYAMHEYVYIFWYLSVVLYKWLLHTLHTANKFILDQEHYLSKLEKSKGEKKKGRTKRKSNRQHRFEIMQIELEQKMSEGYYKALMGFHILRKIEIPEFIKGSHFAGLSYDHRMSPFFRVNSPPAADYRQFMDHSGMAKSMRYNPDDVFAAASSCFENAKSMIDGQPELQNQETSASLLRVCKVNIVVLKLLAAGRKTEGSLSLDFTTNCRFPTFRI